MSNTNNDQPDPLGRGRPKLTPELTTRMERAILAGNYISVVCKAYRVSRRTFARWMATGKKFPGGLYGIFRHRVGTARARFELKAVKDLRKAAREDPSHLRFLLSTQFPHRHGGQTARIRELESELDSLRRQFEQSEADRAAATH